MAAQPVDKKTKKRKKHTNSPMLLVHDRVEVRSIDEGFMGSWHSAVVISCKNRARGVQYDCLLSDDCSQKLIEEIDVHPVFDGITPIGRMRLFHRGLIRPLPPPLDFDTLSVHYGQCVDAYYQEAWWEGVVFDNENDSEFRFIFFPDIGDLLQIRTDNLRITQDWDEFTQEWEPRGNWIFLELIQQIKQENLIHVSVREIWYEVREKNGFEKLKEWTNSSTSSKVWESLVIEVIDEHSKLVAEMFYEECQLKKSDTADCAEFYALPLITEKNESNLDGLLTKLNSVEERRRLDVTLLSSSNSTTHVEGFPTALYDESPILQDSKQIRDDSDSCVSDKLIKKNNVDECQIAVHDNDVLPGVEICADSVFRSKMDKGRGPLSSSNSETTHEDTLFNAQLIKPRNAAAAVDECYMVKDRDIASKEESLSDRRKKRKWEVAGTDIVPEAEFCPDSVTKYLKKSKSKHHRESLKLSLRKHLAYLGWKIEVCREEGFSRMRYTSPKGRFYMSLITLCKDWDLVRNSSTNAGRGNKRKAFAPRPSSCALISSRPRRINGEPANFPEAVKFYANLLGSGRDTKSIVWPENATPKDVRDKAKRHLRASGWSIWTNEAGKKQVMRYTSPSGKTSSSLVTACKAYIDGEVGSGTEADLSLKPRQDIGASDRLYSKISTEPFKFCQAAAEEHHNEGTNGGAPSLNCNSLLQRKGKKTANPKKKQEKKLDASGKVRDDMDCDDSVQCSKITARQLDPSSSFHSPLTVLSWLIDNDVVLPRTKVYYLGKKTCAPEKEGLITREGIKCNCCKIVFDLSKFQAHSGSTDINDQPAANIYLEDGRSLLSCQSQLRNRLGIKNMLTPPPQPKSRRTNDYICSVCHFGGLLVMCDHCPSSFHCECLGLKDIPDGEWFCPQCCCKICESNTFNQGAKQTMKDSTLNCHQCERRYHVGCILKQGKTNVDSYSEGIWFCNKKCEQIFLGLQKLLGKPVVVGDGNLTWTLLKYNPCNDDLDGYGTEPLVETFSKLSLVVSVMHECFEPMHAPGTKRDIVEDVIFSRGSDLSRLNFQGFYTVLLSRDDEVITVASLRVYGDKVAEIPLVGTRYQHRKLGMCRFLMNELEKKLVELGVERLVMPAAPSVLSTWTGSFGFSKVTESERSNLRGYIFLDFQGAVMCQKILTAAVQPIRTLQNICDDIGGSTTVTSHKNSTSSEEFQAEQTTKVEATNQGTADNVATGVDGRNGTSPLVLRVNQQISEKVKQLELLVEERGGDRSKETDNKNQSGIFKCYKRRRVLSAC